jgi:hypothetical protein
MNTHLTAEKVNDITIIQGEICRGKTCLAPLVQTYQVKDFVFILTPQPLSKSVERGEQNRFISPHPVFEEGMENRRFSGVGTISLTRRGQRV